MEVARSGFAAAVADGLIVAFGGEETGPGGSTIRPVEAFDRASGRWSRLPGMRTPRHGLGGASFRGRVYALEGGPSPGFAFSAAAEVIELPQRRRR
jgi:hypothetical protein